MNNMMKQAPLFDFRAVMRLLRRKIVLIGLVTVLCVVIVLFLSSLSPKLYSASTRVLLDEQNVNPFGNEEIFADLRLSNPAVESQMQVMRSPYLLSQVVDRLDLGNNEAFMAEPTTPMRELLAQQRTALFPPSNEEVEVPTDAERFQAAVERLRENLRVSRNAQTLVIRLQFTSASPELAAEVVNAVAETYIENRLGVRQDTAERAAEWFDDRMAELNVRALEVEQQMERLSGGGVEALDASQSAASLRVARQELQTAMADRARAQTEVRRLQTIIDSGRGLRGIPPSLATEPISALIEEAETARADLAAYLQASPNDSAEIERLTARIESLEAAGTSLLQSLLQDAEDQAGRAEASEADAQSTFDTAVDAGGGNITNAIEVELRSLEGEARIYRELHESYLESYLRTVQQQSFPSTEATIIEVALPPEHPNGPGRSRLAILAALIGMTLGAGSAFVLEASDGRVRTAAQLSKAANAPFLGVLPARPDELTPPSGATSPLRLPNVHVPARQRGVQHDVIALPENRVSLMQDAPQMYTAINNPLSPFSETIRRVNVEADHIQGLLRDEDGSLAKIIGFISDKESQGRSIAAVNYAEMLAVGGGRTVLIDLDWTRIFLSEKIAPAAQFGLAELAMAHSSISYEQAFWYDERTSLYFLPNRSMSEDATLDPGAFDQARLKALIAALSRSFDNVVLDLSPMSTSSDPATMSEIVSGFVAVADWGQTQSASLSAELQRSAIYPPKLLGTVLNGVSAKELERYEAAA